ncbi:U3 small nucleolar RNA-associated protein 14 [Paragonimus heterotremus]|uniref:U3 small nucleolar RNA-associated protein 14 n=1 Tax=Paragonimus heterotremus TaxID=100268 RepID=A0A8J4TQP3_9TREM|nr:U3 small nucleolar RNA-associated protein 14 [Paragonimus heterotremus]
MRMEVNIPAVDNANVWGLVGLKKGDRRKQKKILTELHQTAKPLGTVDEISDSKKSRRLAFRGVKRQLTLWKGPVHNNRLADQLIFPLNDNSVTVSGSEEALKVKTDAHITETKKQVHTLQGRLYAALYGESDNKLVTYKEDAAIKAEKEVRKRLLEQISQREKERFLLARVAANNKRQNKIKSKNFHRHQKGRLLKQFEAEMEKLRDNNPRAFAQRILKAELNRAKERASLRHRTGSKFARLQKLRAKYDTEARTLVAEMHDRSKELLKRHDTNSSSESDDSDVDITSESDAELSDEELNQGSSVDSDVESKTDSLLWWRVTEKPNLKPSQITGRTETKSASAGQPTILSTLVVDDVLDRCIGCKDQKAQEDDFVEPESEVLDPDSEAFYRTVREACATDPALKEQFTKEKEEIVNQETPRDIDTFLPGWNSWTGPGLEAEDEKRRKKRLIPAPKVKREDGNRSHLLIKRRLNNEFRQHLVKSIPFPYNTPEQFESVIAQPICREWVTESIHREFTRPKVTVQAGHIIRPISKSAVLLRDKDVERLTKRNKCT